MSSKEFCVNVRVLLCQDRDGDNHVGWVAQCLEYDIAAQGQTIDVVKKRFRHTLIGQILVDIKHGKEPLEGIKKAPREFWKQFEQGERLARQPKFYMPDNIEIPVRAAVKDMRVYA